MSAQAYGHDIGATSSGRLWKGIPMGILDNARSAASKVKDKAGPLLDKVEDQVEKLEKKGGTVGKIAGGAHTVIDKVEERMDKGEGDAAADAVATSDAPTANSDPVSPTTPAATPEGPTELGNATE
jgi:hypothetical protein